MEGSHFDSGKPRVDLLPVEALLGAASVMGYGAQKYSDHNWRGGIEWNKLYASTLRHLFAWQTGEDIDPESGLPHLDHAMCDIGMLSASVKCGIGKDTRWQHDMPERKE